MKKLLKKLFFLLIPKGPLSNDRAIILMYHAIVDRPDYFASVMPEQFERQMAYLAAHHYPVISLSELVRRLTQKEPLGGSVVITFDDGYRDNYTVAYPILKRYQFPATIFVTTGAVGGVDKRGLERLSIEEMKEMEASGIITLEPHSVTHPKLSKLSRENAREEIANSKKFLEEVLDKKCRFFATPYGDFNDETVAIIRECGFEGATTVSERTTARTNTDLFRLPRVSIDYSTTFSQFRGKTSTAVDWYEKLKLWR